MSIFLIPRPSAFGQNLKPSDGAFLFFYEVGTTDDKTSYSDSAETVPHTQPVVADSTGLFAAIYISGNFKAVLKNKKNVQLWSEDDLTARGGEVSLIGDFDSSTNSGDYPSSGLEGDLYKVSTGFTLNAASGGHLLNTGDFIIANKAGPTAIDADWDIQCGVTPRIGAAALVDGANIPTNCAAGNTFSVTLGGNRTLDNPTNKKVGMTYTWEITQDGTGGRTLAFGTDFDFQGANLINPLAGSISVVKGVCLSSSSIRCEIVGNPGGVSVITSSSNLTATDMSLGNIHTLALSEDTTMSAPTNTVPGERHTWVITKDANATARTIAWDAVFDFDNGVEPESLLTTGARVIVEGIVQTSGVILCTIMGKGGWKQYIGAVSGGDFVISAAALSSVTRCVATPYKTSNGVWRINYNLAAIRTGTSNNFDVTFTGVTFKTGVSQPVVTTAANNALTDMSAFADGGTSVVKHDAGTATTFFNSSGDIELDGKPTWAD